MNLTRFSLLPNLISVSALFVFISASVLFSCGENASENNKHSDSAVMKQDSASEKEDFTDLEKKMDELSKKDSINSKK